MSEEELEVLITLDDPVDPPEEDNFHQRPEAAGANDTPSEPDALAVRELSEAQRV